MLNASGSVANAAFSTFITHEYAHFWLYLVPEIDVGGDGDSTSAGFHEGFADTLAHLVQRTPIFAHDVYGCGGHGREPICENVKYPDCTAQGHHRGMLLSKVWLNILAEFGPLYGEEGAYAVTKSLHRGWMLLAQPPGADSDSCTSLDQSASDETLIEVLVIDSPTDDPSNAYHLIEICQAFEDQDIEGGATCEERGSSTCYADCDKTRALDVFDFLCFIDLFVRADGYADCDTNLRHDTFDLLCFQDAFLAGCQ